MRHPLLDTHPLFPLLAAELRRQPGAQAEIDGDPARAAVALVLSAGLPAAGAERSRAPNAPRAPHVTTHDPRLQVLLIERAERDGDPWSGQVALPGGRRDPRDATLEDTAIRETMEETGIDLRNGLALGTLDELRPRTPVLPPIIVTPFVFIAPEVASFQVSDEVADAFWWPWSEFADPDLSTESAVRVRGAEWSVSSYVLGHRVVWGMTERMLRQLATRIRAVTGPA